jgi:hypothetical protein
MLIGVNKESSLSSQVVKKSVWSMAGERGEQAMLTGVNQGSSLS